MMKKILTKIRLINWHYFVNETIEVNGSFLISGENTSGKSTILDAVQLVLTTNTRRFNTAANEKSRRDLKGYVRCKTGDEDNAYLRKGSVISYVALEFYEEKKGGYFTLGVKIDSADEEAALLSSWFVQNCKLDDIAFLTDGRPSMTSELRQGDDPVRLIARISEAREVFARRMGNLEGRFFDMIPKSLAFKPMDNVKDFINKFILPEKKIEVASLRKNIGLLKSFEELMEMTKLKIDQLESILAKNEEIELKEREIRINEILICKAQVESNRIRIGEIEKTGFMLERKLEDISRRETGIISTHNSESERLIGLKVALESNETSILIRDTEREIDRLDSISKNLIERAAKLSGMISIVGKALAALSAEKKFFISREQLMELMDAEVDSEEKNDRVFGIGKFLKDAAEEYSAILYESRRRQKELVNERVILQKSIDDLKNRKLSYPVNTVKLKEAVEEEFRKRNISSSVRIFSDLLEITDPMWQNAVEGYLDSRRFDLLVEPKYFRIAFSVYCKMKKKLVSVGLVDTGSLPDGAGEKSLAGVVTSDNRYAKAYADLLLGPVNRCDSECDADEVNDMITSDCMLRFNGAVRRIGPEVYDPPYIGVMAYEIQLRQKETRLHSNIEESKELDAVIRRSEEIKAAVEICRIDVISENVSVPEEILRNDCEIKNARSRLAEAKGKPEYLEIGMKLEECNKRVGELRKARDKIVHEKAGIEKDLERNAADRDHMTDVIAESEKILADKCEEDAIAAQEGLQKFRDQIAIKEPYKIVENFTPHTTGLVNARNDMLEKMKELQRGFCSTYDNDLGVGADSIDDYKAEYHKLVSSEIIKYEDQLETAKRNCELEFKESFLARIKENIEAALLEFRNLNRALKDIYYGDDRYRFDITFNSKKESLYRMIMSDQNIGDFNLWSSSFETEYRDEMDELFVKLTAYDDEGDKVIEEYTDYRNYLDYDIFVESRSGSIQKFSKIYGEKSGGETQTPYYVAIAASFVQLYRNGDTIRVIMFDEAFDKMDDGRIVAMMDFLNSQELQIVLAAPPSKLEVIGENVDSVLIAVRDGREAFVETFAYEG